MGVRHLVLSLAMLAVCAGAAQGQKQQQPRRDRNVITLEEVEKANVQNVLQAVKRLRPSWLSSRGSVSMQGLVTRGGTIGVYVDGVRRGEGEQEMETVVIEQVKELRYLSAEEATTRFGIGHPFGAIDVITRK